MQSYIFLAGSRTCTPHWGKLTQRSISEIQFLSENSKMGLIFILEHLLKGVKNFKILSLVCFYEDGEWEGKQQ